MSIDLLNKQVVSTIITQIDSSENRDFRTASWDAYQVYNGNQFVYTQNELKKAFPKSWDKMTVSDISISQKVMAKIAKAYKQTPLRFLEDKNEELQELYSKAGHDRAMRSFDLWYNLHRECLFWVNWNEGYMPVVLQPHEYSVIINPDTLKLECVILNYPDQTITSIINTGQDGINELIADSQADAAGNSKTYVMWTDDQHVVVRRNAEVIDDRIHVNIDYVDIPDNPSNVNPLGVLPFVYRSRDAISEKPLPNPLTRQSTTWNFQNSFYLSSANIQGFGQLVITKSVDDPDIGKVTSGLTTGMVINQSNNPDSPAADAKYINPKPDLNGQKEALMTYLAEVVSEHTGGGVKGVKGDSQSFSSALERMISESPVQEIIESNQSTYSDVEKEAFEILKIQMDNEGANIFRDDSLEIIFTKPKVLISDKEVLENIEKRINLGLIEKHEALMLLDPNMSEEAAKEKLIRIQDEKMTNMEAFIGQPGGSSTEGSSFGPIKSSSE